MPTRLTKRAGETRTYTFDFTPFAEIVAGDTLTGTPAVAVANTVTGGTGTAPTAGTPALASPAVKVTVTLSGGTEGTCWLVTCTCGTVGGAVLVCEGLLFVSWE